MADLSRYEADLSPKKRELLQLLLEERRRKKESVSSFRHATLDPIPRRTQQSPAPVSFAQQRLWFIDQLDPGTPAFNIPAAVRLVGRLNLQILQESLDEIVRRHETLRTSFGADDGKPVQIIATTARLQLSTVDLQSLPETLQMKTVQRLVTESCQRSFHLTRCPLMRVCLFRLGEEDQVLVVMMHHIIGDVWSVRVLLREVAALYQAYSAGCPSPLGELPIQYADYAIWQQKALEGETLQSQLAYWREQLADMPEELQLPTDRPRPPVQSVWGAKRFLEIPKALVEAVKALGQEEEATLFMTLLAAWKALLHRYTGQNDIVVGAPVANRNRSEFEGMIGFFVNSLILRTRLSPDLTFRELVRRQREVVLGAFSHQDFPFERLVEALQPTRNLSRNPLFQTDFILQNSPRASYEVPGLSLQPLPVENGTAQLDMTLDLWEEPHGLTGWLEYDVDLFDPSTILRWVRHYQILLEKVVAHPDGPLGQLSLLSAAECHQILREWNDSARNYGESHALFHELVQVQVERTPDGVAATCGEVWLTYQELDRQARGVAAILVEEGVGPDSVVALLARRSLEFLTAILGIFKAGGAYLPLDPVHPAHRHRQILEECRPTVVLASQGLMPVLQEALEGPPISPEPRFLVLEEILGAEGDPPKPSTAAPESLAYVIYTSGSTGTPKGVLLHHRGMLNHLWANIDALGMTSRDVLAQTASQCFDISVWQFLAPLLLGGRVHIFPDEVTQDPPRLLQEVDREGVTLFETVPTLLRLMLEEQEEGEEMGPGLHALRWLLPTGEALTPAIGQQWFRHFPGIPMMNAYGPSECSDDVTLEPVHGPPDATRLHVAIGRPVANLRAHVFDPLLQPVPIGAGGEIYVGGVGVGRGYLGRPRSTAAVFLPDPFAGEGEAGGRIYKTGDLGRYLADGRIEYLGRADHQVKVRGFRIELGEIEAVLAQHPGVREGVVVVREDVPGDRRLVAYVSSEVQEDLSAGSLREFLQRRLPDSMVPSAFVVLEVLPRTPSGKIDRQALPQPETRRAEEATYVAPRNPVEEVLAGMWAEILGLERIGVEDNLFELGAHSLLLTQVVSRVRKAFQVEPPLRVFFECPTVAGMARSVEQLRAAAEGLEAPPIVRVPRDGHLPLSYTQERMWFLDQLEPGLTAYNVPGAVYMDGGVRVAALEGGFTEILRRHEVFRTTYASVQGRPVQVIHSPSPYRLPLVDLQGLEEGKRDGEARRLAKENAQRPFDLARGPVLRAILVRNGEAQHLLAITTHHIAYDMWAREIFIYELGTLYEAFSQGNPSPLPEPEIQYVDYAVWQRQWLQGEVLQRQLDYWRRQLANAPRFLDLPTDKPRPPIQSYRGARQYLQLPGELAQGIARVSKAHGVTPFIVVLAAFKVLLRHYTGQERIVVGSPIANRNRVEVEKLMGFLANTLVLYTDLGSNPTFGELLARVRETAVGAYAHQDIPFEFLVQELQPERDMSRSPLFQVMFNYMLSYSSPAVRLSDLLLRLERLHSGAAQFEINVDMWEGEGGLNGVIEYCTDLFHHTTIRRFVVQFRTLVEEVVDHPERRLDELLILPQAERHQLLWEWNDTERGYDLETSFVERFESQVGERPDAVAVAAGDEQVTYGELGRRSSRLARVLQDRGVGPDVVVGLLAPRGIELLTAILAVLRTGGAYLPLDPAHPARRHAQILAQSGSPVVLTTAAFFPMLADAVQALPRPLGPQVLVLEEALEDETLGISEGGPPVSSLPQSLGYVIYTSGSTGVPKGVMIPQRGMLNHLLANIEALGMTREDTLAQTASQCFDISIWQFLAPLVLGGRVEIVPDEITENPPRLLEEVDRAMVTIFETVPSLLQSMLTDVEARRDQGPGLAHLRWLLPTGEALTPDLGRRWFDHYPEIPLVNAYGPSECSDDVTLQFLHRPPEEDRVHLPIGRPVANLRVHILNRDLRPVPLGVPGELCVEGVGVGRGYLALPGRTATVFVPNPFGSRPGEVMYRSGDLARYLPDGNLEFLGRLDHQVKVRGFRIELGEIESALRSHRGIRDGVVLAREDTPGMQRLVAYLVVHPGSPPTPTELKAFLGESLPGYMVPSAFVLLDAFPLLPNGKVDRKALPPPEADDLARRDTFVPPRDSDEETIASILCQVLGLDRVSIHDDFFDLGGHSLLAVQVLSRIRDAFGVEPPLRALFETSTVVGMTEAVRAVRWAAESIRAASEVLAEEEVGVAIEVEEGVL